MQNSQEHIAEPLDYLYEELPPERMAEVRKHLAECTQCRARIREIRDTVKLYRQVSHPKPPPGIAARVAAAAIKEADTGAVGLLRGRHPSAAALATSLDQIAEPPLTSRERQARMEEEFDKLKEELRIEMSRGWRAWLFHPGWAVAAVVAFLMTFAIHFSPRYNRHDTAAYGRREDAVRLAEPRIRQRIPASEPHVAADFAPMESSPVLHQARARQDMAELAPFEMDGERRVAAAPLQPQQTPSLGSLQTGEPELLIASAPAASPSAPAIFGDMPIREERPALSATILPPPPAAIRDFSSPLPGEVEISAEALQDAAELATMADYEDHATISTRELSDTETVAVVLPPAPLGMSLQSSLRPPGHDLSHTADEPEISSMIYSASDFYDMGSGDGDAGGDVRHGVVIVDMLGGAGMEPPQLIARPTPVNVAERVRSLTTLASLQMANREIADAWTTIEMLRRYDTKAAEALSGLLSEMETAALAELESGAMAEPVAATPEGAAKQSEAFSHGDALSSFGASSSNAMYSEPEQPAAAVSKYDIFHPLASTSLGFGGEETLPGDVGESPYVVDVYVPVAEPEQMEIMDNAHDPVSLRRQNNGERSAALVRTLSETLPSGEYGVGADLAPAEAQPVQTDPPRRRARARRPFTTDPYLRDN